MPVTFAVPVTLVTRAVTGQNNDGGDIYTETEVTTSGVFAPGGTVETLAGGDTVITQPFVSLPTGTVLAAVDALEVAGIRYEVDGDPAAWPPNVFSGWQPDYSVYVKLKKVSG